MLFQSYFVKKLIFYLKYSFVRSELEFFYTKLAEHSQHLIEKMPATEKTDPSCRTQGTFFVALSRSNFSESENDFTLSPKRRFSLDP